MYIAGAKESEQRPRQKEENHSNT